MALLLGSVAFAAILSAAPRVAAQSPNFLSGNACTNSPDPTWQSGDTWILYGNVTVPVGCTLTIEPGAIVKGDPDVHLYVDGTLVAGGRAGSPSQFLGNVTGGIPWAGIEFNAGSSGSVTWSSFVRVLVAITAQSSSPGISNNTIVQAGAGVRLDTSSTPVADNVIDGQRLGAYGILVQSSSSTIARNAINGTSIGIQAGVSGSPIISDNRITNVTGALALGIYATNLASVTITGNTLEGALGASGITGGSGAAAVGILANGTPSLTITGNAISDYHGGRGGAGVSSAVLAGGPGGPGGGSAGIAVGSGSTVLLQANTVADLMGGRGGDGGSSGLGNGGAGGRGGDSIGIEIFSAKTSASFLGNSITNATGGNGGDGGAASGVAFSTGAGGAGGNAYGLFSLQGMNPDLSSNTVQGLRGGRGGNSTVSAGGGSGGLGGEADGLIVLADGIGIVHANTVSTITGGPAGNGITKGGAGGNGTALLILGDGTPYNSTTVSFNQLSSITGGQGGIGGKLSGDGGTAAGLVALHVEPSLASNAVTGLLGGNGGLYANILNQASGGGLAAGISFLLTPSAVSRGDSIQSVSPGTTGGGHAPPASYGVGYYFLGNSTTETQPFVTNSSVMSVDDLDFYVDNYTTATALNTSFSASKVAIMAAGNLTVQNYLSVRVLWPNNLTTVWGARIAVQDNGVELYNRTSPFGVTNGIVVTNRVYIDSPIPVWNTTQVLVTYQTYAFADNPRNVNMTSSQTQSFTMVDTTAPTSSAFALPTWTSSRAFSVAFISSDGFGVGLENVTLWYRANGAAWLAYGNTSFTIFGIGQFSFTATVDGTYQFATTAVDRAGNAQQPAPPTANNTWTIVDTVAPASHMPGLPRYETSSAFTVSWAPNSGVDDVANYTIQVNTGSGWVDWLTNTTSTSSSYAPTTQGPTAFRALARDFAGNLESKAGNDTWTIVDTIAPQVASRNPTGNLAVTPTSVVITFSEPMNTSSVEAAFSISPSVTGTFTWSNGSRTLTFQPSGSLSLGTSYTVTIGTGAEDLAGNALAQASVFTFATPAPPGLSLADLWPVWLVVVAALAGVAYFLVRRRGASAPEVVAEAPKPPATPAPARPEAAIDDVFLLYRRDGVLIKHETRRLRPDIDTDILSGMLTAVQQFVKDSFRGDEDEELNEMTVGQMHILIGRGKWLVLAATLTGGDMASMTAQIQRCVTDMEDHNWDRLEDWDGDMEIGKALGPYLKKLIRGEYAA